jgi:hypothetical protein
MWQVHCFPLCPFSRKVRLALAEKGVPFELVRAIPWDAADAFYALNPTGRTPVLHDETKRITLSDRRSASTSRKPRTRHRSSSARRQDGRKSAASSRCSTSSSSAKLRCRCSTSG